MGINNWKVVSAVVVLVVLGIVGYYFFVPENIENYEDLSVLKYGESCDPEAESRRINATLALINANSDLEDSLTEAIWPSLSIGLSRDYIDNKVKLCNIFELLRCNPETRKCDCGEPGIFMRHGHSQASTKYVKERGVFGTKKCRWTMGSYCVPPLGNAITLAHRKPTIDYECGAGTTCRSVDNYYRACNWEMVDKFSSYNLRDDPVAKIIEGQVCTCRSDQVNLGVLSVLTK